MAEEPEKTSLFWTGQKTRALELVWQDRLTNAQIAAEVGVGERSLSRWKAHPQFQAALGLHYEAAWQGMNVRLNALWSGRRQR